MSVLYSLFAVLVAAALILLLLRPGVARPMTVWGLAALLPVLAALSASLAAQGRAARVLDAAPVQGTAVTITTAGRTYPVTLDAQDAACLERALRLKTRVILDVPPVKVPIQPGTRVSGPLPDRAAVEALSIRGALACPRLRAQRQ